MASEPHGFGIGQGLLAELPKALAAGVLAVLGLAWRGLAKHRRALAAERELIHATAEATRRNADVLRFLLYVQGPGRGALDEAELDAAIAVKRHDVALSAARLWQALGQDERRAITATQEILEQSPEGDERA